MMERFYTPEIVAKLMVDFLPPAFAPISAIDICSGSWNLLRAARNRWPDIEIIGVDTDRNSKHHAVKGSRFFCEDGRKYALRSLEKKHKYPLILANPPFEEEKNPDQNVISYLPGISMIRPYALRRLETTMILANLALLSDYGCMAIVVPKTLVKGQSMLSLRTYISQNYSVTRIVHLPTVVFGRDISTSIVFLQATGRTTKNLRIYKALIDMKKQKYKVTYRYSITAKDVREGIWDANDSFHAKSSFDYVIKRGQISNSDLSTSGKTPVLHNSDITKLDNDWEPTRYVECDTKIPKWSPYARSGDIVITRVGRNSGLFNVYSGDKPVPISDCILVIKYCFLTPAIYKILQSPNYIEDLNSLRSGVNVKYITINTLREYINKNLANEDSSIDNLNLKYLCGLIN